MSRNTHNTNTNAFTLLYTVLSTVHYGTKICHKQGSFCIICADVTTNSYVLRQSVLNIIVKKSVISKDITKNERLNTLNNIYISCFFKRYLIIYYRYVTNNIP